MLQSVPVEELTNLKSSFVASRSYFLSLERSANEWAKCRNNLGRGGKIIHQKECIPYFSNCEDMDVLKCNRDVHGGLLYNSL